MQIAETVMRSRLLSGVYELDPLRHASIGGAIRLGDPDDVLGRAVFGRMKLSTRTRAKRR